MGGTTQSGGGEIDGGDIWVWGGEERGSVEPVLWGRAGGEVAGGLWTNCRTIGEGGQNEIRETAVSFSTDILSHNNIKYERANLG